MSKNKKPFNNAFEALKALKQTQAPTTQKKSGPPPRVQERAKKDEAPVDEGTLFRQAMGDVAPVKAGPKVVVPDLSKRLEDKRRLRNEDEETMMRLSELVAGQGPMTLTVTHGSVRGQVQGLDERLVHQLREGGYPLEAQLDLHGLTRQEAKEALERFVHDSRMRGRRCVLVIHGRGLNSPGAQPVLKEGVQEWLSKGRASQQVLAFCSARAEDGGEGALYVLIRQR